jgi:hypothetical protein
MLFRFRVFLEGTTAFALVTLASEQVAYVFQICGQPKVAVPLSTKFKVPPKGPTNSLKFTFLL